MTTCGCCTEKDPARVDAFGSPYGCVCHNHMDIPNGIRPGKCEAHQEHRGSRPGVDPTFADAAFREFTPEQTEMVREKLQGFPEEMRPRVRQHLGGLR